MSRRKVRKTRSKTGGQVPKVACVSHAKEIETVDLAKRERYFEFFVAAVLLAFGLYHSVLYFGYRVVPTSDFPAFVRTGHELLSFRLPSSFKRVPVLGLLIVPLGWLVGGQHPDVTAGQLLNGLLHPFNLILLWLVSRKIVGKSAPWFAIIAVLNPWVIRLLTDPIAETTLLFFILLTFYFIFKRSNWCYVFASITMMTRYEGAALIMVAFVMDMIYCKSRRERIRAFLYSAMATVPLAIWILGTFVNWQSGPLGDNYLALFGKEYSKLYVEPAESRTGLVKHINVLWQTGFHPLLIPYVGASKDFAKVFWSLSKTFVAVSFFFGSIYGLLKRNWNILALLLFFVPYFVVHSRFPEPLLRYHMPVFWIALLLCLFGLQSFWKLIDGNGRVPKGIVLILQALVVIVAIIWLITLVPYLSKISPRSPTSASLPYVAMILVALIFAARLFIYKSGYFLRELCMLALVCLIIVSNQFILVRVLGDGQREKEFRSLANWYVANAKPGEKMVCYMSGTLQMFAPKYAKYFVSLPKADSPEDFVRKCYEKGITYVVWASREALNPGPEYEAQGLKNIELLIKPRDIGPYQFVTQIGSRRGWINVFRLRRTNQVFPNSK